MAEMKDLIEDKVSQIKDAVRIAENTEFKKSKKEFTAILLVGMGGSGIGGKIVSQVFKDELKIPFLTHHGYGVPAFVNDKTLVIASSYSGNTEETINAVHEIESRGAEIVVVTSGGKLLELGKIKGWNFYHVPGGEQPRAMLAYSIIQQIFALSSYGLISESILDKVKKIPALLKDEDAKIKVEAQIIAQKCYGKIPVIYAGDKFEGLATRFRQQLNENAKVLCWHHVLPELTHNELVAWSGGDERYTIIYLKSNLNDSKVNERWNFVLGQIESIVSSVTTVEARGIDLLSQTFYLIHLTDWVSLKLSQIKNVDPNEVDVILNLKKHIGE